MAGGDRGNMRCFEATGCGAVLFTDSGSYPEGFVDGETMVTYSSPDEIPQLIQRLLRELSRADLIAKAAMLWCGTAIARNNNGRGSRNSLELVCVLKADFEEPCPHHNLEPGRPP